MYFQILSKKTFLKLGQTNYICQKFKPEIMPKIQVEVSHSIEQHVAVERIKGLLNKLKAEYGDMIDDLKEEWHGNRSVFSFKAMGMSVEGILQVSDNMLSLDGKIPFAALPFKGTIEKTIKEEARKLLS